MLSCKEIIELASNTLDKPLPLGQRLQFKLHLFMCSACKLYLKQLQLLQQYAKKFNSANNPSVKLSAEARDRIRKNLPW